MNPRSVNGVQVRLQQVKPIPLDVTLNCANGELLALVGPSGSGKTTILRCIAGLATASSGRVVCNEETWWLAQSGTRIPTHQRRVGIVFQSYALFDHMTARQNIEVGMSERSSSERIQRSQSLMELVNLAGLESRMPSQLSGGQRQRVALARALARKPRVLLLDEPFSAVDLITRRKLRKDLIRVRRSLNIPIILVTHDLDEAYQLADNLSIVHHGITLHSATPEDFINRPVNAEVARLTGQTNIFDGVIESHHVENDITRIRWQGRILECLLNTDFEEGESVQWVVPQNRVILHQRVRPSRGEAENPVEGQISEMMKLGDSVALELLPDGSNPDELNLDESNQDELKKASLSFTVPLHVAERNTLAIGERIGVSLKTQGIHLMRQEKRTKGVGVN